MADLPSPEVPDDIDGFSFSPAKLLFPKFKLATIPFPPSMAFAVAALPDFPKPSTDQMSSSAAYLFVEPAATVATVPNAGSSRSNLGVLDSTSGNSAAGMQGGETAVNSEPVTPSADMSVVYYSRAMSMDLSNQAATYFAQGDKNMSYILSQVSQAYGNISSPGGTFNDADATGNRAKARAEDEVGSMIAASDPNYVPLGMIGSVKKADGVRVRSDNGTTWYEVSGDRDQAVSGGQTGRSYSALPYTVSINYNVNQSNYMSFLGI